MTPTRLSLRSRIFLYMILLVVVASVLIAAVTVYQYNEEAKDYHEKRLERKEDQLKSAIQLQLRKTTYPITTENLGLIFKDEIYEIASVQNLNFILYDLDGTLLIKSKPELNNSVSSKCLPAEILNNLSSSFDKRYVEKITTPTGKYQSSYTIITDAKSKPLGILNLPYEEDNSFSEKELTEFLKRLSYAYIFMLLIAIVFAYFISRYITKSLKGIGDKLDQTRLNRRNEKIILKDAGVEIFNLVAAYNGMIDELEESAVKLAKSEREQAWREMAKQVAHEIKNPLTPMRLSVQSFQRKFDPSDPNIHQKIDEYSKTLIQQIDTMSSIASAFSNFAKMPAQQNETLNVVEITRLALDIFNENYIHFHSDVDKITAKLDRTQLIRVITNLVKNAIQAIPQEKTPDINVSVGQDENYVFIRVKDNGIGITEENKARIFEPKFTTKTSGMGLGLGMVKNIVETYKGSITFTSEENLGTEFTVNFPKE